MLDVVAAEDAVAGKGRGTRDEGRVGGTHQHDFGAEAIALQLEGHAVLGLHTGLLGPGFGFGREQVRERAESSVSLEHGQTFSRDFVAQGLGQEFSLLGRSAALNRRRDDNCVEERSAIGRI